MASVKIIEMVGSSSVSWEDAAKQAVASITQEGMEVKGVDVLGMKAKVEGGNLVEYRASMKVSVMTK